MVSKNLNKEITSLKEDIETARQNDFGRKLFESFASEYANSYLNEKSETAKLLKVVDTKNRQLAEAKNIVDKTTTLTEAKDAEIKKINESVQRSKIMNDLIAPLGNDQREIMSDLLESVQTSKLEKSFNKYLPTVIEGNSPAKKKAVIVEGKEITGNKEETNVSRQKQNENVVDIRRLAGLN
jgi:CHAT domain-containing protein